MKRSKEDPVRENRIIYEAVVDAYGPEERAIGWYYYLENKIRFPFQAQCTSQATISPLRKGEEVEVRRMAPVGDCSSDMLVMIRWQGRTMAVPLLQLSPRNADEPTLEAVEDWHYWVKRGYMF